MSGKVPDWIRKIQRQEQRRRGLPPGDKRHGSPNGYQNFSCRCTRCRNAQAEYMNKRRKKNVQD